MLEPIPAIFTRKTYEASTETHRHVMRKLVAEGGWVQKRLNDISWSDVKKGRGCNKEEGTEKHKPYLGSEISSQMNCGSESKETKLPKKIGSG